VHCTDINHSTPASPSGLKNQDLAQIKYRLLATNSIALKVSTAVLVVVLVGCASKPLPPHTPAGTSTPTPAQPGVATRPSASGLPMVASWAEYRRRAAQMILGSNPGAHFTGAQPQQWNGIATVTIMLNADGSIRATDLMRGSKISPEINNMALAAARRVGNYGSVSHLPQPWQFNETFLYNDDNKFQLVTIVEGR
jgi:outer membrane biosynthesis protein TonB